MKHQFQTEFKNRLAKITTPCPNNSCLEPQYICKNIKRLLYIWNNEGKKGGFHYKEQTMVGHFFSGYRKTGQCHCHGGVSLRNDVAQNLRRKEPGIGVIYLLN